MSLTARGSAVNSRKIFPVFLPNLGCRSRCVFCNQYSMTGETVKTPELVPVDEVGDIDEIAFYGGTFTWLPRDLMLRYLSLAPDVPKRISTRPDAIDGRTLEILKTNNVRVIELGVESLFDDVLESSKRGYDARTALLAVRSIIDQFDVVAHLMLGLPNSTWVKDLSSTLALLRLGVRNFRLHPTLVFSGTELEKLFQMKKYEPLSLEEAVELASEITILIEAHGGRVLRLGYHVPETQKRNIVAGPYHPSFGDMVRATIVRRIVTQFNIKRVRANKRFAPWLYAFGNSELDIDRHFEDSTTLTFDGRGYSELIETLARNIERTFFGTTDYCKLLFLLESICTE